jgi:hypothetical protein
MCGVVAALCATLLAILPAVGATAAAAVPARTAHRPAGVPAHRHRRRAPARVPLYVSLAEVEPGSVVPQNFLGLSFEVAALPQLASYAGKGDLVTLLRSLGDGVLRFGGVTADHDIAWTDPLTPEPAWATGTIEAGDLDELGILTRNTRWHVLLTLGMGHFEPQAAAREAAAAQSALGDSLEALELGNEPNAYATHGLRTLPWTFVQYEEQVSTYRSAIEALAPGIALAGPDTAGPSAFESWGLGEAIDQRPALLTGHFYPLTCSEQPPPSIAHLLSPSIRLREEVALLRYLYVAEHSEIPFRLDETGSVSCGGTAGVSDTFAAALWAVSYIAKAMSLGATGINFHGSLANCQGYAPLCAPSAQAAAAGELRAQPEWYALLLARELVGERPLKTNVVSPEHANAAVSAFQAPDGTLRFVLVDDDPPGDRSAAIALNVGGGYHGANVLALTAPGPQATSGVRLGGRQVAADGLWSAPASLPRVPNRHGVITVEVPPSSAALVTVSPLARPGVR